MPRKPGPRKSAPSVDTDKEGVLTSAMLDTYGLDCPVAPAVWRKFTSPTTQVDLIVELDATAGPAVVAFTINRWLQDQGRPADVMMVTPFVVVSVDVAGLVSVLVPLTSWHALVAKAAGLSTDAIRTELDDARAERAFRPRENWDIQELGRFRWLITQLARALTPRPGAETRVAGVAALLKSAANVAKANESHPIKSVAENRAVRPAVLMSRQTVKADAAELLFHIDASNVTWAIIDSGIDATNPAFMSRDGTQTNAPMSSRVLRSFDVPRAVRKMRLEDPTKFLGLVDEATWTRFAKLADTQREPSPAPQDPLVRHHGTHVAGVLAADERPSRGGVAVPPPLVGVCPTLKLVDIRVFDDTGRSEELWVLVAMRFVRWMNEFGFLTGRSIDGVNLSLSTIYEVDAQACGWTPVCQEAKRLVDSGVVVVAAAGNQAYDIQLGTASVGTGFRFLSITDPGNAEAVITVGATDKESPHRYGPIASSGRGPTADGRHKPDVLAPGNLICGPTFQADPQEMTGTSQAAPHVSGIAAMLLARFPELKGQPERVKRIICESATDMGRLQDFQGAGLVDALRALQRT